MSLRKSFESTLRQFRSYLLPSHRSSAKFAHSVAQPVPSEKPLCVFDFHSIKIDNVTGRYLYHLVTEFEALGYSIAFTDRFRFLATMKVKACKKLLLSHPFSIVSKENLPSTSEILVTDNNEIVLHSRIKKVLVNYDLVRAKEGNTNEFELPFFVHPEIHESGQVEQFITKVLTKEQRPLSILFAGNAKSPKYDAPVLNEKYQVLSRVKALKIAEEHLHKQTRRPNQFENLTPSPEQRQSLTIATTQDMRIPSSQWIETLALADFYFACPGVEMPLCHNLIESLAAGAIPILQYPQYLTPALEDGVNCLIYHDAQSLKEKLDEALSMPQETVKKLQLKAQQYYSTYQQPGSFAQQLISSQKEVSTLYLNAYRIPH